MAVPPLTDVRAFRVLSAALAMLLAVGLGGGSGEGRFGMLADLRRD